MGAASSYSVWKQARSVFKLQVCKHSGFQHAVSPLQEGSGEKGRQGETHQNYLKANEILLSIVNRQAAPYFSLSLNAIWHSARNS